MLGRAWKFWGNSQESGKPDKGGSMKTRFLSLPILALLALPVNAFCYGNNSQDGYMQGHPGTNDSYYSPTYDNRVNSPNFNSNYYNDTYGQSNNTENNAPQGNDIRDYNPYYDRDGKLKGF